MILAGAYRLRSIKKEYDEEIEEMKHAIENREKIRPHVLHVKLKANQLDKDQIEIKTKL